MAGQPYYDVDAAKKMLRWLKPKLRKLEEFGLKGRNAMEKYDLDTADELSGKIQEILEAVRKRGIIIRDQETTLVDFPAVINNIPAYLCWKTDEKDIAYWHYADEGFAGRKKINGNERILSYL